MYFQETQKKSAVDTPCRLGQKLMQLNGYGPTAAREASATATVTATATATVTAMSVM
jgi:hypothetical protein